ncbi:DUF853 family protein [Egibacter rhizosphaerae]|uniref:DUF853 family protein n=1 Tax=Egibacter rhizosphaerae TaxID=1670831 RepID=A0A411YGF7_9ACTN|nr:FtsK/SpoIIIE domain-containing protein [Egibacter rhizosphaerae]QBI20231.1 DUF853 family protein [Egibacter rhizosphaerae]
MTDTAREAPRGAPRTWQPSGGADPEQQRQRDTLLRAAGAAAVVAAAAVALAVWLVLHGLLKVAQASWWWGLLPAGIGVAWTFGVGLEEIVEEYAAVYRTLGELVAAQRWDQLADGWTARVLALAPASVAAGSLAAAATRGWAVLRAPSWRSESSTARANPRRAARMRRRLERDASRPAGAVVLGMDPRGDPVRVTTEQLAAHALLVGASGSGKTTTALHLTGTLVHQQHPVAVIDLKGDPEVAEQLRGEAAHAGVPFAQWTPEGPGVWNPLGRGDATRLKEKLIAGEQFSEPHYRLWPRWCATRWAAMRSPAQRAHRTSKDP